MIALQVELDYLTEALTFRDFSGARQPSLATRCHIRNTCVLAVEKVENLEFFGCRDALQLTLDKLPKME